eukprot:CAMPEP_0117666064 /NCGR_PEP_ID=MMETSP0804-20121206/10161_1 /TAXON_ID=1074897 /ORGANISM="Tetraselmis astigmatica, Strain CCMP880" /LENGTH=180 /DNA_ID=CAMNT_0005473553 /DNA_START=141 /DNA_END=680 /DNA_ORIENTATION=+
MSAGEAEVAVAEGVVEGAPTEEGECEAEEPAEGDAGDREDGQEGTGKRKRGEESVPLKLGFKTFNNASEATNYFCNLLRTFSSDLDINDYEHAALLDLLQKGHPNAEAKIGAGVKAFQIQRHHLKDSACFHVVREDNTAEDFSYLKCLMSLFPDDESLLVNKQKRTHSPGGGRGRGGGRG